MPFILIQQLAAGWLTLNWVIGYGVAPVLFSQLETQVAGAIMAVLLSATYWVDSAILLLMLFIIRQSRNWTRREGWLLAALLLVVLNLAGVSPIMADLKQLPSEAAIMQLGFAAWHGFSQLVFLGAWFSVVVWVVISLRDRSASIYK